MSNLKSAIYALDMFLAEHSTNHMVYAEMREMLLTNLSQVSLLLHAISEARNADRI